MQSGSTPSEPPASSGVATARVTLAGQDWHMEASITVPAGPVRLRQTLPMVQSLTNFVVDEAVRKVEAGGERVSCKKGCGACCRQLVPISEVEARQVGDLIQAMPEPRRSVIRERFARARRRLAASGVLDKLMKRNGWAEGEGRAIGMDYFEQGIPCPFLEDESCSIYADRPVSCREYLVTSPAENCRRPSADTIRMVPLPFKVWTALARFDEAPPPARYIRWVPLILAPYWAEENPEEPPARPGPALLEQFFDNLKGNVRAKTDAAEPL